MLTDVSVGCCSSVPSGDGLIFISLSLWWQSLGDLSLNYIALLVSFVSPTVVKRYQIVLTLAG